MGIFSAQKFGDFAAEIIHGEGLAQDGIDGLFKSGQLFEVGRNHQNRHRRDNMPDAAGDFAAVHPRHEEIQYYQVEGLLADQGQCLISILCLGNGVPINIEQQFGCFPGRWVILVQKYAPDESRVAFHIKLIKKHIRYQLEASELRRMGMTFGVFSIERIPLPSKKVSELAIQ